MDPFTMLAVGAGTQAFSSGMNLLDEWLMGDRRRRQQLEQQQKLTNQQVEANKALASYGMGISKEMWDYTNYENQRKHMENAGLNPALMYGHAGAGGTTSSTGAGTASGGVASDEMSRKMASLQAQGMALQNAKLRSEIDVNKSIATKNISDAELSKSKTTTEDQQRDYLIEELRQRGMSQWLDNVRKDFMNKPIDDSTMEIYGNKIYGSTSLQKMSLFTQDVTSSIAKTLAETGNQEAQQILTSKKAEGYFQELLNAMKNADSQETIAAAIKLATEWETGEYTNWRTWVNVGAQGLNSLTNAVGITGKINPIKR